MAKTLNIEKFKFWDSNLMEYDLTIKAIKCAFVPGFLISGFLGQRFALMQFESYSAGKNFGNKKNAFRRKMDYSFLMFTKNGLRGGFKMGILAGVSFFCTTQFIAYKKKYSSFYLPLISATISSLSMIRIGTKGLLYGFSAGLITGTSFSIALKIFSLYNKVSTNEGYWLMKELYEKELNELKIKREKKLKEFKEETNDDLDNLISD